MHREKPQNIIVSTVQNCHWFCFDNFILGGIGVMLKS